MRQLSEDIAANRDILLLRDRQISSEDMEMIWRVFDGLREKEFAVFSPHIPIYRCCSFTQISAGDGTSILIKKVIYLRIPVNPPVNENKISVFIWDDDRLSNRSVFHRNAAGKKGVCGQAEAVCGGACEQYHAGND